MAARDSNVWHQVHAQREDGVAAMFLIRDVEPRADQPKIFVVELPYAITDLSGQPDAAGYRRLGAFQDQWIEPACAALGWTFVAWKSEDGSFFLYLYGAGDPEVLLEKLAPFDGELGFFNDLDAEWSEYAALRELVEQAELEGSGGGDEHEHGHHDHGHGHHHHHHDDHGHSAPGIRVIDLTGEAPALAAQIAPPSSAALRNGKSRPEDAEAGHAEAEAAEDDAPRRRLKPPAAAKRRAAAARGSSPRPSAAAAARKPGAAKPARRAAAKPARPAATRPATGPVAKAAKRSAASAKRSAASAKRSAASAKRATASAKRATASAKRPAAPAKRTAASKRPRRR